MLLSAPRRQLEVVRSTPALPTAHSPYEIILYPSSLRVHTLNPCIHTCTFVQDAFTSCPVLSCPVLSFPRVRFALFMPSVRIIIISYNSESSTFKYNSPTHHSTSHHITSHHITLPLHGLSPGLLLPKTTRRTAATTFSRRATRDEGKDVKR